MFSHLSKILLFIPKKEQYSLVSVAAVSLFSGLVDLVGVASILPVLAVVNDPTVLETNMILKKIQNQTNLSNIGMIFLLASLTLVAIVLNQTVRIGAQWYSIFVSHRIWRRLMTRQYSFYLSQSYLFHLSHHSANLLEQLQVRVNAVVAGVIIPTFIQIAQLFTISFIFIGLLIANAPLTIMLIFVVGSIYVLIYRNFQKKLLHLGSLGPRYSARTFRLIGDSFSAIKEIKLKGNESFYVNLFSPYAKQYADAQVRINLLTHIPGGVVEIVGFGILVFVGYFLINTGEAFSSYIPLIGFFVMAFRRILPAVQNIYQQAAVIKSYQPSLDVIHQDLVSASEEITEEFGQKEVGFSVLKNLNFENIKLNNVCFRFPNASEDAIDNVSFTINKGEMVGVTGYTGSGKTTLIDLLIGIFEPTEGEITLNGVLTDDNSLGSWKQSIGYVPQFGFITDDTIINNIAFGEQGDAIELNRVKKAAKMAQLSEFIENELPDQYETILGERGTRLSGGQRQRISIARAFYSNPKVVVFDEATSSLDFTTERLVVDQMRNLSDETTVIFITHRVSSLKYCDRILLLDQGRLIDDGNYETLRHTSTIFSSLISSS